jgi:hypothetical protein
MSQQALRHFDILTNKSFFCTLSKLHQILNHLIKLGAIDLLIKTVPVAEKMTYFSVHQW